MDRRRNRPRDVELQEEALWVRWRDGGESRFPLELLRRHCPCALCREQRDRPEASVEGELPLLSGEAATATARARSFEYVGRYGVRITWADGHDHGIYTFEALRELGEAAA